MKNLLFFLSLLPLFSCSPRVSMKAWDGKTQREGYLVALPQTVLYLRVNYLKTYYIKGPYAEYAEKYLGLKNTREEDDEIISISDVNISAKQEADTSAYYFIERNYCLSNDVIRNLSAKGMLYDPVNADYSPATIKNQAYSHDGKIIFSDVSVKNLYEEKTDTLYKILLRDSIFVKLPVLKNRLQIKNTEEVARETADLIIRIRARRLEILAPEEDEETDGKNVEVLLKNLDLLEGRYLKLFTGFSKTENYSRLYTVIPQKNQDEIILKLNDLSDEALRIKLTQISEEVFPFNKEFEYKKSILCRIPAKTRLEIFFTGKIAESYIYISQLGNTVAFPVKLLPSLKE